MFIFLHFSSPLQFARSLLLFCSACNGICAILFFWFPNFFPLTFSSHEKAGHYTYKHFFIMANEQLSWSFGLRNADQKYLTVEAFGSNVNFNAKAMKKKQIFFLENIPGDSEFVYLKTWQGKYITVDKDGKVGAGTEAPGDDEKLHIDPQADGTWSLKTIRDMYILGRDDGIEALIERRLPEGNLHKFTVHLAMHPQVCMYNVNRKRYLHLNNKGQPQITCDEDVPWGDDAVLNLDFFEDGTYGIQTADGTYLQAAGSLGPAGPDAKFVLGIHQGEVAFKHAGNGKYLTCSGANGFTRTGPGKDTAGQDELFVLEDSHPQIKMTASVMAKNKVSIRGGIEVAANQKTTEDTEIFQLEAKNGKWALKSYKCKYWSCNDDGAIKAEKESIGDEELFTIKWLDHQLALVASNGKLVSVTGNSYLKAAAELTSDADIPDSCRFVYELVNRPRLVLRGEYGFIGTLPASGVLECNKSQYETFSMHVSAGVCEIKGSNDRYFQVSDDRSKITVSGTVKQSMYMEFVEDSKFAIRYKDSDGSTYYLKGEKNGGLNFKATEITKEALWEF